MKIKISKNLEIGGKTVEPIIVEINILKIAS